MDSRRLLFGPLTLDLDRSVIVARGGDEVRLGRRGSALLHRLLRAEGTIVSREELIDAVWPGAVVEESNLSVQIAALRKALASAADGDRWIVTIPRTGYRFVGPPAREAPRAPAPVADRLLPERARRASIAVLPFANIGNDPGQEYFSDAVTDEIIDALARFRWFHVIARSSSFAVRGAGVDASEIARKLDAQYVLEGSVQKSGARIRLAARLIDAKTSHQLWAGRFDAELGDLFAVQDRIATEVAAAAEPELLKSEAAQGARRRRVGNEDALDIVYQGMWYFHRVTQPTHLRARVLFRQALTLDPDLVDANVWLARVSAGIVAYGWSEDETHDLREGRDAALVAVRLDEQNPYPHYALAIVSVYADALDDAVRAAREALARSPGFALAHLVLGMAQLYSGNPPEAVEALEAGLRLNPHDPQNFVWYDVLALAHLFLGNAAQAKACADRALGLRPGWRTTLEIMACIRMALNDRAAAAACIREIDSSERPLGTLMRPLLAKNPAWARQLESMLRLASGRAPPAEARATAIDR